MTKLVLFFLVICFGKSKYRAHDFDSRYKFILKVFWNSYHFENLNFWLKFIWIYVHFSIYAFIKELKPHIGRGIRQSKQTIPICISFSQCSCMRYIVMLLMRTITTLFAKSVGNSFFVVILNEVFSFLAKNLIVCSFKLQNRATLFQEIEKKTPVLDIGKFINSHKLTNLIACLA